MSSILEKVMNTKPHISVTPFEKKKFLIYGPAGVGKSTFFSKFKNHLFLNTDPGIDFIKVRKIPITSWKQFKKLVEELERCSQEVQRCMRTGYYYKNTTHCTAYGTCPYMPLCLKEKSAIGRFEQRENLHAELNIEEDK